MKKLLAICSLVVMSANVYAQEIEHSDMSRPKTELKYNLSKDGSKYIKGTFNNQLWVRWNESNPGTTVNGMPADNTLDIGLRRTRLQLYGPITDHVFFYTQFGMNNFNFLSQNAGNRKLQAFFHDAVVEYKVFKKNDALKLGGGLTITTGLSRFTQPSASTIMTGDLPVFLQVTVDQTDEFARKLSIYARGQVGKFDYRVALGDPFPIQTNGTPVPAISKNATFTTYGHSKQVAGFFMYNFFDKESHVTPYMNGTYLGDKKILNLEGGVIYQKNATWRTDAVGDTLYDNMILWSVAAFLDMPIKNNKYALNAYAGYFSTNYGDNYIRNNGIMNPANGTTNANTFSGGGNSYPMFGTGTSIYTQLGFRLPNDLFEGNGTLMPYVSYRTSNYDRLKDPVNVFDAGVNWLINKHNAKVTLNYGLRPIFTTQTNGDVIKTSTAGTAWLQYQVAI
jgi:hypothetical protein